MKVTSTWVRQHFPFLGTLLDEREITGRKRLALKISLGAVKITPPSNEGASRYTSMGRIGGKSFTHYAGSDVSVANTPQELLPEASPMENLAVNPGCYYAILDLLEYYGCRELTIYLNADDVRKMSIELKNQLTPLKLVLPELTEPTHP